MSTELNITIDQGGTWTKRLSWQDSLGVAYDLADYTAQMMIRRDYADNDRSAPLLTLTDGVGSTGDTESGIVLGADGDNVIITIADEDTETLPRGTYVYDLELESETGFKLKTSFTTETPGSAMAITYLTIPTTTTAASQDNLYPLDINTLTLTGLTNPTEVRVFSAGTTTEIAGQDSVTSGTFSAQIDAGTYPSVDISILSLGYQNIRLLSVDITDDVSIPIQQQVDRQYLNP